MKRLIYILLLPFGVYAQNVSVAQPFMRVNRTEPIVLTTSWQDVVFNGTSTNNGNTYGQDSLGVKFTRYDLATNRFIFKSDYTKNIQVQIFPQTTTTNLINATALQYRFVIPNGVSNGVDFYFPFPDAGGYGDLISLTRFSFTTNNITVPLEIRLTERIRTNGLKLQFRLSNALGGIGTSTVNSVALVIQSDY